MRTKLLFSWMSVGASIGLVASFLQMLEKITLLKHADAVLSCNINSVFSCTNVLNAWQSSVFGFPNSLLCIVFFALLLGVSLAGIASTRLARVLRLSVHGLSLFFLLFGMWFLWQSTFVINALCIFCIFCFSGLLIINASLLRLNYRDLPLGNHAKGCFEHYMKRGIDILAWILLAASMGLAMLVHFR